MTIDDARLRVIIYSLGITGILIPFFFLAPSLGYPLSSKQARVIMAVILPVFLGYLGSAVSFVFNHAQPPPKTNISSERLLGVLLNGSVAVFALGFGALIFAFGHSNRAAALPGTGMSFDDFSTGVTTLMSIMTATIGAAIIPLFGAKKKR